MNAALFFLLGVLICHPVCGREIPARLGEPMRYVDVELKYPGFALRFVGHTDYRPPGTRLHFRAYVFDVLGTDGKKLTDLAFMADGLYDTCMGFSIGERLLVAEMFVTTAGEAVGANPSSGSEATLPADHIIVWDLETARASNPRLLREFERFGANPVPLLTAMAVTFRADARPAPAAVSP